MSARPIPETVERFRHAVRDGDLARMYGILEGLASCLVIDGDTNPWATATLRECARIGHRYRNSGSSFVRG